MSVNTHILLPNEARPKDVLLVLGILCGKKATMEPLGNSRHVVVEGVKLRACENQFGCGYLTVDGVCSLFCIANTQSGQVGQDYHSKTGFWISCPWDDFYQRLGVEIVKFFGGEVDFNDCDDTDVNFAWPVQSDIMACNGEAWDHLHQRIFAVKPISRKRGKAA